MHEMQKCCWYAMCDANLMHVKIKRCYDKDMTFL